MQVSVRMYLRICLSLKANMDEHNNSYAYACACGGEMVAEYYSCCCCKSIITLILKRVRWVTKKKY